MKVLAAILMFVTMGVLARAQTPPTPPTAPEARVLGGVFSNRSVKNSPFSADAVSESIQVLPDGNRIVRSSTSKMYRNSEGRLRQELTGGTGGMFGSFFAFGDGVSVINPMGGGFSLDAGTKIARVFDGFAGQAVSIASTAPLAALKPLEGIKLSAAARAEIEALKGQGNIDSSKLSPEARQEIEAIKANAEKFKVDAEKFKVDAEKFKVDSEKFKAAADEMRAVSGQFATAIGDGTAVFAAGPRSKWDTRTEELGEQNIEGVNAKGTRTITTIPAGAIGNDRPIETVYEKWYSPELQVVVLSKHTDPRFGEQTYRLTNINRSEPDPSLFQVPSGYKVVSGGQGGTYTFSTKAQEVGRAATVKPAQSTTKVKNQN